MDRTYPEFADSTVLVTGGASGIGLAITERFLVNGARVIAADYNGATLAALEERHQGETLLVHACDLTKGAERSGLVAYVEEACDKLDVLVNCAGRGYPVKVSEMTEEAYDHHFDVLLKAPMLLTKGLIPLMKKAPAPCVVNIGSVTANFEWPDHAPYATAKAALVKYTRHLVKDVPGIRANTVNPGIIQTPIYSMVAEEDKAAFFASLQKHIPLGRIGTPDDVARVVLFLCSDDGNYINGAAITVDGGYEVDADRGL
jgi:NAD(P)-dependent dehydrogenase (short-subunit alcohol dehydrogenase family)